MLDKIHDYIEQSFTEVKETRKVKELKDELFENLKEKYSDQIQNGKSKQESYNSVISGIGDLSELIESVKEPYFMSSELIEERKKRALRVSIAIALFIISPFLTAVLIVNLGIQPTLASLPMFILIAVGTGLLVYNGMTKQNYSPSDDTIVEEFKEWRVKTKSTNLAYKSFMSAYWMIIVGIFLIVNICFDAWSFSWIIFIIGAAGIHIVEGVLQLKDAEDDDKYE
ncbi:TMEM198/TM7SF3 family protein [Clostridioides sp. ES-S-0001-02]|uniref:TMEM198/TM7SF3 family protein n=1 Tax=Clostridioides sp. ES-S-0001-02 TaxID=2770770 RepID=UPI001D1134CD|nr:hypothetical protein [Clostridioides sp. ES-S-0001-02]